MEIHGDSCSCCAKLTPPWRKRRVRVRVRVNVRVRVRVRGRVRVRARVRDRVRVKRTPPWWKRSPCMRTQGGDCA